MRAIGIVSGGLDSLLAIRLVQRMDFEVLALHFFCGFESTHLRGLMEHPDQSPLVPGPILQTGATCELIDLRTEFASVLARPRHGYGANLNPCIDCKILMLTNARKRMEREQAAFVFTGEVIGQRPMSQRRQALDLIAKESGLGDRLVRPLSGALLPKSAAEVAGQLQRDKMESIQGRTRTRQMELARELGVTNYPAPAGGCLLTDPAYAARAADLLERRTDRLVTPEDPLLLLVGRHLVLPRGAKAVIGRHHQENQVIERFASRGPLLEAQQISGPQTLVEGTPSSDDLDAAARLTARYGKGRTQTLVPVQVRFPDGGCTTLSVPPDPPPDCKML